MGNFRLGEFLNQIANQLGLGRIFRTIRLFKKLFMILGFVLFVAIYALTGMMGEKPPVLTPEEIIEKVVKVQFSDEDGMILTLLKNPEYYMGTKDKEWNESLRQYLKSEYEFHFTKEQLPPFMQTLGDKYHTLAFENGYQLTLKNLVVEPMPSDGYSYNFVATVAYQKEGGEEKVKEVEGNVSFADDRATYQKIESFTYTNDNGLESTLKEK